LSMTRADIKKMFRQRDRNRKISFSTEHLPPEMVEIEEIDLSVLEEPAEKLL